MAIPESTYDLRLGVFHGIAHMDVEVVFVLQVVGSKLSEAVMQDPCQKTAQSAARAKREHTELRPTSRYWRCQSCRDE